MSTFGQIKIKTNLDFIDASRRRQSFRPKGGEGRLYEQTSSDGHGPERAALGASVLEDHTSRSRGSESSRGNSKQRVAMRC